MTPQRTPPFAQLLLSLGLVLVPGVGRADTSLAEQALVETQSARSPSRLVETPLSISVVSREELMPSRPGLGLDEALDLVPGVFAQSGCNFAQDTRVSIRGFGARAPFGIRGIRILVDGIPTTLPDGQSEVDSLDLAFVDRIEVIRGPVSSLYGVGGGGTIAISTLEPTESPVVSLRSVFGTDHLSRYEAMTTGTYAGTGYALGLASTRISGYRDHARARHSVLFTKLERELADGTQIQAQFNAVWAPDAEDAGGLRASEVAADRGAANPRSRLFDAGEQLDQQKLGLRVRRSLAPGREIQLAGYHIWRDFSNKLPFNKQVAYDRRVSGGSLLYTQEQGKLHWTSGIDLDLQDDQRRNYENLEGTRGALTLRQSETVRSVGSFAQAELRFDSGFGLVGGLRYDWTEFKIDDRFVAQDGDQSDRLRFRELSPRLGLRYGRSLRFQAYANYATAFRVPTTTELKPIAGGGGFDSDIEPERTSGLEIGAKGLLAGRLVYDVAAFDLRIRNALIPYSDATSPGNPQTFFTNAGEVRRRGLEVGLSALLRPGLSLRAVYTYADYRYHDFDRVTRLAGGGRLVEKLDGHWEPNTPRHHLSTELRLVRPSGLFAVLAFRTFSDIEVNDENTAESAGATLSDLRVGYTWQQRDASITPVLGVRNWTRAEYDGTLRPNAGGARYFEPAPETELYVALEVRFGR
jgi:iron complex outermembrane receptor protein